MMKTNKFLWFVCCLTLLLGSCSGGSSGNELEGKDWVLTDLNGQNPINEYAPRILFEDGQISGNTSCNHYGGSYQLKGETIRFDDLYSSEMACLEPAGLMEQENLYLELLRDASHFQVSNDVLTIFTDSGEMLIFESGGEKSIEDSTVPMEGIPASGESVSPEPVQIDNPPVGFKEYRDALLSISIQIPEDWVVTDIVDGRYAIFQSYPEDKYVGGEMFEEGDTKCDLNIQPPGTQVSNLIAQWEAAPMTEIISREEVRLQSGLLAERFVIDSMGRSMVFAVDTTQRAVLLTCFGDFSQVDAIAATLKVSE